MHENIKKLRLCLGLSQEAFGAKLEVTGAAISRIEAGDRSPSNKLIRAICKAYNVREEWLHTGEGEMFTSKSEYSLLDDPTLDPLDRAILSAYISSPLPVRKILREKIMEKAIQSAAIIANQEEPRIYDVKVTEKEYRQLMMERKAQELEAGGAGYSDSVA